MLIGSYVKIEIFMNGHDLKPILNLKGYLGYFIVRTIVTMKNRSEKKTITFA